jgi:hypothetical protein
MLFSRKEIRLKLRGNQCNINSVSSLRIRLFTGFHNFIKFKFCERKIKVSHANIYDIDFRNTLSSAEESSKFVLK